MLVTVFADASFCARSRAGGWGCYLVSQRGRHEGGGAFAASVKNSSLAEAMAVVNAIYMALRHGVATHGDKLLIQSDCTSVEQILIPKGVTPKVDHKEVQTALQSLVTQFGLMIEFRWVKGHAGKGTPRTYANTICDQVARKHMRTKRGDYLSRSKKTSHKANKRLDAMREEVGKHSTETLIEE